MAAAIPVLVDWMASDPHGDPASIVLRHVNYGVNPFEKSTVLYSVRVSLDGLSGVEFTLVPFGEGGRLGPLQHVQLRFIFEAGMEPELLDLACAVQRRRFSVGANPTRKFAPAGSNRCSHRGNEVAEAFDVTGHFR